MSEEALRVLRLATADLDNPEFIEVRDQLAREIVLRKQQCSGAFPLLFSSLRDDELTDAWLWITEEERVRVADALASRVRT